MRRPLLKAAHPSSVAAGSARCPREPSLQRSTRCKRVREPSREIPARRSKRAGSSKEGRAVLSARPRGSAMMDSGAGMVVTAAVQCAGRIRRPAQRRRPPLREPPVGGTAMTHYTRGCPSEPSARASMRPRRGDGRACRVGWEGGRHADAECPRASGPDGAGRDPSALFTAGRSPDRR